MMLALPPYREPDYLDLIGEYEREERRKNYEETAIKYFLMAVSFLPFLKDPQRIAEEPPCL